MTDTTADRVWNDEEGYNRYADIVTITFYELMESGYGITKDTVAIEWRKGKQIEYRKTYVEPRKDFPKLED
jgi:hypothetical protein